MTNIDNTKSTIMKNISWPNHWRPMDESSLIYWKMAKEIPFPGRKNEDWRWINYEDLNLDDLELKNTILSRSAVPEDVLNLSLLEHGKEYAPFIDQVQNQFLKPDIDTFSALNAALAKDGSFIYVPENTLVQDPIKVQFSFDVAKSATVSRAMIWLAKGASAKVELVFDTESRLDSQAYFNFQLEIRLDDDAQLNLLEVQKLGTHVSFFSREYAQLNNNAKLNWVYVALGSHRSKNFITVDLIGEGSEAIMNGAYLSGSGQLIDLDTQQNHFAPHTHSDLLYKGAVIGEGKAVWEGMIYVDPLAQQTNSYQSNQNLVLDERADVKTIPGLEINANDVSCSHGATVGRLNDDELFYLESRGIPKEIAEKMIVEGFFGEVLRKSGDEAITEILLEQISQKFDQSRAETEK